MKPYPSGLSNGAAAGITIAVLIVFFAAVIVPIALMKRRKAKRREAQRAANEEARARLVNSDHNGEKEAAV